MKVDVLQLVKYGGIAFSGLVFMAGAYALGRRHSYKHERPGRSVAQNAQIELTLEKLTLTEEDIARLMNSMELEMEKGLASDIDESADLKMIPTYVRHLPDGSERGKILAVDLGGTHYRVLEVELEDKDNVKINSKIFVVPETVRIGEGEQLFEYLAKCVVDFLKLRGLHQPHLSLAMGFTFSFPCQQMSLNAAKLITWTKDFRCADVVGTDVVSGLQSAINKHCVANVQVMSLVNDTVGTLMTCAYKYDSCYIGAIFGTGTNACYVEKLDRVQKWKPDERGPSQVIINTEWGALGDHGCLDFLRTEYDKQIDKASRNPGKQRFEKMISGMYLGELTRIILLDLIDKQLLFPGILSKSPQDTGYIDELFKEEHFTSHCLSDIEQDSGVAFTETKKKLESLGFRNPSYDDCAIVRSVCERVSKRAAVLSAAAIAVLINRIGKPKIEAGIDGSLFRHHPRFRKHMETQLHQLVHRNVKYRLVLSEDGSGKGAALVAAVADRIKRTGHNVLTERGIYDNIDPNDLSAGGSTTSGKLRYRNVSTPDYLSKAPSMKM